MRLLIVGTLKSELITAAKIARERGAEVAQVDTVEATLAHLRAGRGADLLFVDIGIDIRALVAGLLRERFALPVIACGGSTDRIAAVAAIHAGAKDYIPLPPDPELIAAILEAVTTEKTDIVFRDEAMARVLRLAGQIATSDASVLITGESGVGKEVMARFVHDKSRRASRPFVAVNCAAIPENLLESELFGHEKGAFTGAIARRIGKFEEASGGMLLLDEISEMEVRLQSKLLRALQERVIDRVGGTKSVPVDLRIIATSNRNLAEAVRDGQFREDLFYRLNVFPITIPPLRNRREEIPELARRFIARISAEEGRSVRGITQDALDLLGRYDWPGNVRQLENVMFRAIVMSDADELTVDEFPQIAREVEGFEARIPPILTPAPRPATMEREIVRVEMRDPAALTLLDVTGDVRKLDEVESEAIKFAIDHYRGQMSKIARKLGIGRSTLYRKLRELGMGDLAEGAEHETGDDKAGSEEAA